MYQEETIGDKTEMAISRTIKSLWAENRRNINEAYDEEGELSIAISVKLGAMTPKGVNVPVGMQFIKEKIKNESRFTVDEKQFGLFERPTSNETITQATEV